MTFEVHVTRSIAVPVRSLYEGWTETSLMQQWWGPTGFTCPVARLDVRVGGTSLVAMRAPSGIPLPDIHNAWTYTLVEPDKRLEFVSRFADADGNPISPGDAGIPANGVPEEVPHVLTFERIDDATSRLTVVERGYGTDAARDMSADGMEQCVDKLEQLLTARPLASNHDALEDD